MHVDADEWGLYEHGVPDDALHLVYSDLSPSLPHPLALPHPHLANALAQWRILWEASNECT